MSAAIAGQQPCARADVGARQFEIATTLTLAAATATLLHMAARAAQTIWPSKRSGSPKPLAQFRYDDSGVQAEFLVAFASDPQHPEEHREFVASLLNRYAPAAAQPQFERPFFLASVQKRFAALFGQLTDGELTLLFRHPQPEVDFLQDGLRESLGHLRWGAAKALLRALRAQGCGAEGPRTGRIGHPRKTGAQTPTRKTFG